MMKSKLFMILGSVCVLVLFAGCVEITVDGESLNESTTTTTTTTTTITNTTTITPFYTPTDVAYFYMDATLGTLPTAIVDYDLAETYLTAEFGAGMDYDPYFVQTTYCIQNGPDDVYVVDEVIDGDFTYVTVQTDYGFGYEDTWMFDFELEDDEWKISYITCLY